MGGKARVAKQKGKTVTGLVKKSNKGNLADMYPVENGQKKRKKKKSTGARSWQ